MTTKSLAPLALIAESAVQEPRLDGSAREHLRPGHEEAGIMRLLIGACAIERSSVTNVYQSPLLRHFVPTPHR
jgi:hypothetical protein